MYSSLHVAAATHEHKVDDIGESLFGMVGKLVLDECPGTSRNDSLCNDRVVTGVDSSERHDDDESGVWW